MVIPIIRDASIQLLEYGAEKAEIWIEKKAVPVAKAKIKFGWENLKLFASSLRDANKPTKASQIIAKQQKMLHRGQMKSQQSIR